MLTIFDQKKFFNYDRILIEFCLLIPNIRPKVLNSVVKGVRRAFEVPLSYIGPLYDTCYPKAGKSKLKIVLWVPTVIAYMIKKELDVYLRVPGNARKKTTWISP